MPLPMSFTSKLIVFSTTAACRLFLHTLGGRVTVYNHRTFQRVVFHRPHEVGLVTVSNHASVLDDPLMWSCAVRLSELFKELHRTRWILGAQEICFKNRLYSWFFSRGRVIPIVRGAGLLQEGVNRTIELLRSGEWVHVFSEGKVNQTKTLLPFRWGVGKFVYEPEVTPIVLPLYHWGMIDLMPENRKFRYPRPCRPITVLFGEPMDFTSLVKESKDQKREPKEVYKEITDKIYFEVKKLENTVKCLVHATDEFQVN